jgi:hypothetical protein
MCPLTPASPAFFVITESEPELVCVLLPESNDKNPPVVGCECPAFTKTTFPTSVLDFPTDIAILPLSPCIDVPEAKLMRPLAPLLVVPEINES